MTDPEPEAASVRPGYSIEAAAIAGLAFAVLYGAVLVIFMQAPAFTAPGDDIIEWYSDPGHRGWMVAAFNLAAFSAIAFLWFVGVIRRRIGEREDQFFATVFLSRGGGGGGVTGRWLASMATMTFTTNAGPFDISLRPDGTDGYEDLAERTQQLRYRDRDVPVASLEDVIRSKEAAGREKDLLVIPALRAHLRRMDLP